jgi:hypothetical protein
MPTAWGWVLEIQFESDGNMGKHPQRLEDKHNFNRKM